MNVLPSPVWKEKDASGILSSLPYESGNVDDELVDPDIMLLFLESNDDNITSCALICVS